MEKALCSFPPLRWAASFSSYPIGLSFSSTRTIISGIFSICLSRCEALFFCLSNPRLSQASILPAYRGTRCTSFLPLFVILWRHSTESSCQHIERLCIHRLQRL